MGINEILQKNNPMQKKTDRENRSDFAKLVDRNTELVDENKWLKADNDILKSRIDKAVEYVNTFWEESDIAVYDKEEDTYLEEPNAIKKLLNILKGEDKE